MNQFYFFIRLKLTTFQFQDLDMIASIVAKEQAMLKMSGGEHSRLSGLSLAQHHTQVIVNG